VETGYARWWRGALRVNELWQCVGDEWRREFGFRGAASKMRGFLAALGMTVPTEDYGMAGRDLEMLVAAAEQAACPHPPALTPMPRPGALVMS